MSQKITTITTTMHIGSKDLRQQRLWIMEHADYGTPAAGILGILDHIAYELERAGDSGAMLTEDSE